VKTPIERLSAVFSSRRGVPLSSGQRWSPLVYRSREGAMANGVGFISDVDPSSNSRTLVALGALPRDTQLDAEEVTVQGAIDVTGNVADEQVLESAASPIYVYKLNA
jgi:hypothetical protein